jgi:midasin (ATPase involved in ribosome maturation)
VNSEAEKITTQSKYQHYIQNKRSAKLQQNTTAVTHSAENNQQPQQNPKKNQSRTESAKFQS